MEHEPTIDISRLQPVREHRILGVPRDAPRLDERITAPTLRVFPAPVREIWAEDVAMSAESSLEVLEHACTGVVRRFNENGVIRRVIVPDWPPCDLARGPARWEEIGLRILHIGPPGSNRPAPLERGGIIRSRSRLSLCVGLCSPEDTEGLSGESSRLLRAQLGSPHVRGKCLVS